MPIRDYRCPNGHVTEYIQLVGEPRPASFACGACGHPAKNVPAPFASAIDKETRLAAFAAKGAIPWEPGLEDDARRARDYRAAEIDRAVRVEIEQVVRESDIRPD